MIGQQDTWTYLSPLYGYASIQGVKPLHYEVCPQDVHT